MAEPTEPTEPTEVVEPTEAVEPVAGSDLIATAQLAGGAQGGEGAEHLEAAEGAEGAEGRLVEMPMAQSAVEPIVAGHLAGFADVLQQAWAGLSALRSASPAQMAGAGLSTRGMLVSDFTREPAHRVFDGLAGVSVDDRYGRPWVCLAEGRVQVRFRKLTPSLQVCVSDSERATRLAFHLGDPLLPLMPEATVLTAGYVLDPAELALERLALVCHIGSRVYYLLDLPGGAATASAPTQLPMVPLSAPIIRSARAAAAQRLAQRASGDV